MATQEFVENMNIIFLVFGLQIVLALIVIIVLKKLLDRELIESALELFEVLKYQGDLAQLKKISVVSHKPLNAQIQERFKSIATRRFKGILVDFVSDPGFKGGVKVIVNEVIIDCSLIDRLSKLFHNS